MKLSERFYIGQKAVTVVSAVVSLTYQSAGTASIVIAEKPSMNNLVAYEIGYNNELTRYFFGYIESYKQIERGHYALFCREIVATLRNPLPLAEQHKTLDETLAITTAITGVEFVTPGVDYTTTPAPYIINHASGYNLIDSLGDTFNIPRYYWHQQGDGRVWVGSWYDSPWANKNVTLPQEFISKSTLTSAHISTIPKLRPGVMINGQRVRSIQLQQEKMIVTWITN